LVRPSGTEPKLKIYTDLRGECGDHPDQEHRELLSKAAELGALLAKAMDL
jgi:phosphomannomutase